MSSVDFTSWVQGLARPAIVKLKAYSSARSIATNANVYLDANESPWTPFDGDEGATLNRYPDPQPAKIRESLASLYGVEADHLILGRGADDSIDTLIRTFCESGRNSVLICAPTYGVYGFYADIQGVPVLSAPLKSETFELDPECVEQVWQPGTSLIFLCSPNNPTANLLSADAVEKVLRFAEGKSLVVVDEAYLEYSSAKSWAARLREFPHLVVLRTLSKAWSLAGARCGVAIASPQVIALLQKVRAPYPLSTPQIQVIEKALRSGGEARARAHVAETTELRRDLCGGLARAAGRGLEKAFPSDANYVLFRLKDAQKLVAFCREKGILIRDRSGEPGLAGCVRISVGNAKENAALVKTFQEFYELS